MNHTPIWTKTILVVTNYLNNSVYEFDNSEQVKSYIDKYKLKKVQTNFIGPMLPIPNDVFQQIVPVSSYISDKNITIKYDDIQKTLSTSVDEINENIIKDFSECASDFIDTKISDINAIGINFISQYNLQDKKLKILNNDIENHIKDFSKNKDFQVTLVLQLDNYQATYKIRKISGGDNTGSDRIYQIDANLHFILSTERTSNKINQVSDILSNLYNKYYVEFISMCNQILEMNDEQK